MRAKGWVVRPGMLYGVDFVAYRLHPAVAHSDYFVLVLGGEQRPSMDWIDVQIAQRLARQVFKRLLMLHVDLQPGAQEGVAELLQGAAVCEVVVQRFVPNISYDQQQQLDALEDD